MKHALTLGILVALVGLVIFAYLHQIQSIEKSIESMTHSILGTTPADIEEQPEGKFATLVFTGDVMLDRKVRLQVETEEGDWTFPFRYIRPTLKEADVAIINLEGPLTDIGQSTGKKYSFRFPPESMEGLEYAGVDIASLANNHSLDYGRDALCDTVRRLEASGITPTGAGCTKEEALKPAIVTAGNTSIAIVGLTEFFQSGVATDTSPGITPYTDEYAKEIYDTLRNDGIDIIAAYVHWGEEYVDNAPDRIRNQAMTYKDIGYDIIVGHHPHVDQEVEQHDDTWIAYSLGNFIFDQDWAEYTMESHILEVTVGSGKILNVRAPLIKLTEDLQPRLTGELKEITIID